MKAIIPIGGRGTRMRPVTFTANKHFIPVGNKPLIFYPIETIADAGIKEVAITYNPGQLDYAKKILGTGRKWGLKFTYVLQAEPKGLANIFEVCEDWVGNDLFFLHLGDNIFPDGIKNVVKEFKKSKAPGMIVYVQHKENTRLGVPLIDKSGNLIEYVEKPKNPPNNFGIPGLYFFSPEVYKCFKGKDKIKPSSRGEYEIGTPYNWMVKHGCQIPTMELKSDWLDPGKFNDWLETNQYLLDRYTKLTPPSPPLAKGGLEGTALKNKIEGRVEIGKKCKIKNSTIRGPVKIGDGVTIKDSFIGPFTSIYHECKIKNCRIENSVLMQNVRLGNIAKPVDNSILGPDCEVDGYENGNRSLEMFLGEMSKISL